MKSDWREQYQLIYLDCIARDKEIVVHKATDIVRYARGLAMRPIINDAAEELKSVELALSDALADIREARRDLKNNTKPVLQAAE